MGSTVGQSWKESIRVGGYEMDQAVIAFAKKEYSLMLGERTAGDIKMAIGSAYRSPDEPHAEIRGRDLVSGLAKTIVISAEEVRHAIQEPVSIAVDIVKSTLDKCPPELAGDVMERGIALTGGGALLRGFDERLREETGMPIHLAGSPLESVVLGTGKCVEDLDALRQVLVPETRRSPPGQGSCAPARVPTGSRPPGNALPGGPAGSGQTAEPGQGVTVRAAVTATVT